MQYVALLFIMGVVKGFIIIRVFWTVGVQLYPRKVSAIGVNLAISVRAPG